jgi:pantetheine-phosphate adenylyltransferase
MPDRIGVYPGSFDPPTLGHLDMIERAARMFDKLIVAVAKNSEKSSMFTADERKEMLRDITGHIKNITIDHFTGLTVDFAHSKGSFTLIRGLRAISDFEYELTMASTNRKMRPEVDTIILMPNENFMFISSRLVKEIAQLGGDVSPFLPKSVISKLHAKLKRIS